ncbi:MAG: RNA methyltransferase [Bacteroidia bacterium]
MQTLSKAKVKHFAALQQKKYRYLHRMFLVEGEKMVQEALACGWPVEAVLVGPEQAARADMLADELPVWLVEKADFQRITSLEHPEGILAVLHMTGEAPLPPDTLPGPAFLLEDIQDPGNLGNLLRTADWLGLQAVVAGPGCADRFNPKALRASMGSVLRVPYYETSDLAALVQRHRDRVWVADMDGQSAPEVQFAAGDCLLLGNEARGISPALRAVADLRRITIPRWGGAESLNVATAGAMLGWQLRLQQPR